MLLNPSHAKSTIEKMAGVSPVGSHIRYAYRFVFNGPIPRHISIASRFTVVGVTVYVNRRSTRNVVFPDELTKGAVHERVHVSELYPIGHKGKTGSKGFAASAASLPTLDTSRNEVLRLSIPTAKAFDRLLSWYFGAAEFGSADSNSLTPAVAGMFPSSKIESSLESDISDAANAGQIEEERQLRAILTRRGQPNFRKALLRAYEGKCAITGCDVEEVLEAAHIVPHTEGTDWDIDNGLPLRADIHTLYDRNLLSISKDYVVHVSPELVGTEYGKLEGTSIRRPRNTREHPHADKLTQRHTIFLRLKSLSTE